MVMKMAKNEKARIELGDEAKDSITGFSGIVIGDTTWLHGCRRLTVQPKTLKDGKPLDPLSFDEPQLVLVKKKAVAPGSRETGGPRPEPRRR